MPMAAAAEWLLRHLFIIFSFARGAIDRQLLQIEQVDIQLVRNGVDIGKKHYYKYN